MTDFHSTRKVFVTLTLVLTSLILGACGSSSDSDSPAGKADPDAARAAMDKLLEGDGYSDPPTSGPKPEPGKEVWVLSCGQTITNCSIAADAAVEAAESLGWDATLYDTQFSPVRIAQGVRQAIAADADGIVTYLIDCSIAQQPLQEARDAGVKTSTAEALQDCDEPLYDAVVSYGQGDYLEWLKGYGESQAKTVAAGTDGAANTILLKVADVPTAITNWKANKRGLEECPGCSVAATVSFTNAEVGGPLKQKVQQALVQNPDANAIITPADSYLSGGVLAALRATGRLDDVYLGLGEGDPTTMDGLRNGELTNGAGVGIPEAWEAYQAVDNLNRLFNGEGPKSSGIGLQAFDADTNVPESGAFDPTVDWRAGYEKLWGIDGQ